MFVDALVLTQSWFPQRYWDYALHFNPTTTAVVLARDVVLVGLLLALLVPDWKAAPTLRQRLRQRLGVHDHERLGRAGQRDVEGA